MGDDTDQTGGIRAGPEAVPTAGPLRQLVDADVVERVVYAQPLPLPHALLQRRQRDPKAAETSEPNCAGCNPDAGQQSSKTSPKDADLYQQSQALLGCCGQQVAVHTLWDNLCA